MGRMVLRKMDDKDERKEREEVNKGTIKGSLCEVLLSREVVESPALFDDRLCVLLEDAVHVSALSRPQALQEPNVTSVTRNKQGQVRILLHCFYGNGCKNKKGNQFLSFYFWFWFIIVRLHQ